MKKRDLLLRTLCVAAGFVAVALSTTKAEAKTINCVQISDSNNEEPADSTVSTMEKCKSLTPIGSIDPCRSGHYILEKTPTGVAVSDFYELDKVAYSTDGNDVIGNPRLTIGEISVGDADDIVGLIEWDIADIGASDDTVASCRQVLDEDKDYIGIYSPNVFYEYYVGRITSHRPYYNKGSQESVTPSIDVEGMSGTVHFAETPENADKSTLYNVGIDIKEKDGRYVDITFGVYNEEQNFAQVVEYNNIDTYKVSPYWEHDDI